ncbi:MAG: glycine cleavage system aminomethyltransferase GcvT [Planctomycetota bacterium]
MHLSPLHDLHVEFGAKLVEFAGWSMPLLYTGIIEEHQHTRNRCSVFDVSHMGRLRIGGPDAEALLQWTCTRNLGGMDDGQCRYSHVCKEDGGILDDVIVSRYAAQDWLVVCNGVNREKILAWLVQHAEGRQARVTDQTFETAMVAVQGPDTRALVRGLLPIDLSGLKRYRCLTGSIMGFSYAILRSGYTGEDGYEAIVPAGAIRMLIPPLLGTSSQPREDIKPAGLGARDTLRLEAGMPLYGHELSEEIDPLSAGQAWCVDLSKDFIGADAVRGLDEQGLKVKLVGLEIEGRRIARQHTAVLCGGEQVGQVTSGTRSPTLGKSIAMASVASQVAAEGTKLQVNLGAKRVAATVVKLPFYSRQK